MGCPLRERMISKRRFVRPARMHDAGDSECFARVAFHPTIDAKGACLPTNVRCRITRSSALIAGFRKTQGRGAAPASGRRSAPTLPIAASHLWDDTFVRYQRAAYRHRRRQVLEALGFNVVSGNGRKFCGRSRFQPGQPGRGCSAMGHIILISFALEPRRRHDPVLEPSCFSMFVEDYRELKLPDMCDRFALFSLRTIRGHLLEREGCAPIQQQPAQFAIHAHCTRSRWSKQDSWPTRRAFAGTKRD